MYYSSGSGKTYFVEKQLQSVSENANNIIVFCEVESDWSAYPNGNSKGLFKSDIGNFKCFKVCVLVLVLDDMVDKIKEETSHYFTTNQKIEIIVME